ncbi:MAG: PepSY domain-containing protein [Hyphomicrobiaceae bacterium]|nr:MAG: PepSY domain-containing protein [Hyphomicrobiaceae bacterium]
MFKNTVIIAAALALLASPALASSDDRAESEARYELASGRDGRCTARPDAEWLSVDQLTQKLKDQGYTVRKVERSHGCYEVKATDAKGVRVEIHVDPATAEIISREGRS